MKDSIVVRINSYLGHQLQTALYRTPHSIECQLSYMRQLSVQS